jgi:DNA polymerase-3 subunit delta
MSAKAKNIAPIYVISGKDAYLQSSRFEAVIDGLLTSEERAMCLYQVAGKDANITDVLDELRTLPFLAERRVVAIRDGDKFISENRPILEKYFEKPSPSGVLVLVVQTWLKTTRLAKMLAKVGQLIAVEEMKPGQLPQYAANYAKAQYGKGFDRGANQLLVELAGDSPGRIASEVDKLAVYVGSAKSITADDIEKLIGHNRSFNVFAVIDAITAGNAGLAVERLRKMFASDKDSRFTSVGAFAFQFRRMFNAKVLISGGMNEYQAASKLRIWGNKDAFFKQLRGLSLERIAGFQSELARIDYAIKTGGKTPEAALEMLVMKMAS